MANKRMFNKNITETDVFLDMSSGSQILYFHLNMNADDAGFVASPRKIIRMIGSANDDYKVLLAKRFIFEFESGVCLIKDWKIHNLLRQDRVTETLYKQELALVTEDCNKSYILDVRQLPAECQHSIDKVSIDKVSIDKVSIDKNTNSKNVSLAPFLESHNEAITTKGIFEDIINYLNSKAGTNYKSSTPSTKSLINSRLKEGFSVDDFHYVIDNMCDRWLSDNKMRQYLRPTTIFGAKFESYLNCHKVDTRSLVDIAFDDMNDLTKILG